MLTVVNLLKEELGDVDQEVVQYCATSLQELHSKAPEDVLYAIGPFAEGLGVSSTRLAALCEELATTLSHADGALSAPSGTSAGFKPATKSMKAHGRIVGSPENDQDQQSQQSAQVTTSMQTKRILVLIAM